MCIHCVKEEITNYSHYITCISAGIGAIYCDQTVIGTALIAFPFFIDSIKYFNTRRKPVKLEEKSTPKVSQFDKLLFPCEKIGEWKSSSITPEYIGIDSPEKFIAIPNTSMNEVKPFDSATSYTSFTPK